MLRKIIPLSIPNFAGNERRYVNDAVEQGWVSTGGAYVAKFEENLGKYVHSKVAVCQSGTTGLHLAMIECDVQPGDMVIVPTLTFIAAVNPVRYQFAEPVFMDCDDSLCMDPIKLEKFCHDECEIVGDELIHRTSQKHIKAVVVVHVFGNMADMEAIMEIAEKYHLKVVEDATEALGTYYTEGKYNGKFAGTIGDFGVYSFNGNKIITTGGGGAVTAKAPKLVDHMRYLSTQAKDDPHYYVHNEIGYNYRMTNLQAALGVAQLEKLPQFIENKHHLYELYEGLLQDFPLGELLPFRVGTYSNQWFFSLKLDVEKIDGDMRHIIEVLHQRGVQTRPIWGLIHEQLPYLNCRCHCIEKALYYSKCILNIPCSTQLRNEDVKFVIERLKEVICCRELHE